MRFFTLLLLTITLHSTTSLLANQEYGKDSLAALQKEVLQLFHLHRYDFPDINDQVIDVGFMINAKSELIILDVEGESDVACDYVKEVLNYKKLKFNQARQLIRY